MKCKIGKCFREQHKERYMEKRIEVVFTRQMIREGVTCYWKGFIGLRGFILDTIALGLLIYLWQRGSLGRLGDLCIAVVGVFLVILVLAIARDYFGTLKAFDGKKVSWTFSEDGFAAESHLGSILMKWEVLKKIWKFKKYWILVLDRGARVILPVENSSPDILGMIEGKIGLNH
jgi:hypothetical protein